MKSTTAALVLLTVTFLALRVEAQVKIPETRLRIVYKDTGEPVEWVQIVISCYSRWKSKAEKREYQEKIGGFEASKKTTYGGGKFLHAEDGWIIIPEVSNVPMDSYTIEINPAGGQTLYVTDPGRFNSELRKNNLSHLLSNFDQKTFPKFVAVPVKDRVLLAPFTAGQIAGTLYPSYEEARFFLAAYKIDFDHWPDFAAASAYYSIKKGSPSCKSFYWGAVDDHLTRAFLYVDPTLCLPGMSAPLTDEQRVDLLGRMRLLFCGDIEAKLLLWGDTAMPLRAMVQESQMFGYCWDRLHCEYLDTEGKLIQRTSPPSPSNAPASHLVERTISQAAPTNAK